MNSKVSTLFEIEATQTGSRRTHRDRSRVARTLPHGHQRLRYSRAPGSPALTAQLALSERNELVVHDGHSPGHTALWLPPLRVLIAGDMLSDVELPLPFYPDDLPSCIDALDRLAPYAARAELVIPGHGHVGTDALARLDADRRYIDNVVSGGASEDHRIAKPGMDESHAHLMRMARRA